MKTTPDGLYTLRPTHLRLWSDGGEWFIDGRDDDDLYTDSCWSYDTFGEAVRNLQSFVEMAAVSGVTFEWRGSRR